MKRKSIEDLKKEWLKDPCWNIEETEGFEAHHKELLEFRLAKEKEWKVERIAMQKAKINKFKNLKLHESHWISDDLYVTRVVSGWIYKSHSETDVSTVFVPLHNEADLENMVNELINSL